jgi:hypothetical protein
MRQLPKIRSTAALVIAFGIGLSGLTGGAQAPAPSSAGRSLARISEADTRVWLTYLSSDLLQGRAVFTEGYGLAASYVAEQLRAMGVKPLGTGGSYLQPVVEHGYRVTRNSSITIERDGVTRTFRHGEHVLFPLTGARRSLSFKGVEFAGYGAAVQGAAVTTTDLTGRNLTGKLAVYVPGAVQTGRGMRGATSFASRSARLVEAHGAAAVIGFASVLPPAPTPQGSGGEPAAAGSGRGGAPAARPDLVTVLNVEHDEAPLLQGDETFFRALFGEAPDRLAAILKTRTANEPLAPATIEDVTVTISIDNTYEVVQARYTSNVVAMVEGSDPQLRDTYVFIGAHLDHVGYANGPSPRGRVNVPVDRDRIWNGADDDGSGSAGLLAIAKAFAEGPKPRRSVVFVWHAGEESGLLGSTYMADNPVVPLDRIQAQLNVDMIGRNRDDKPEQADTLYLIGADRISTDLHNLLVDVNARASRPLTLDYEFNDPADPNSFYTRSDHYSYAAKGIPVAFFFTGEHPDYHANTDTVDKIIFPKLTRIAQFIYESAFTLADRQQGLVRDNRGPRSGVGFSGRLD